MTSSKSVLLRVLIYSGIPILIVVLLFGGLLILVQDTEGSPAPFRYRWSATISPSSDGTSSADDIS
jgi:hypothetical protein